MGEKRLVSILADRKDTTPTGRIVRALSQRGPISAREIGEATGLAKSTVSTALNELRRTGMVVDGPESSRSSGAGRPAAIVSLNPEAGTCVGLLLGMEHMQLIVADVSHKVLAEKTLSLSPDYTAVEAARLARQLLETAYRENDLSPDTLLGVGMAMAGPVDPKTGVLLRAGGMPDWAGLDIRGTFEPVLQQAIIADNESNCSALAEMMWGSAVGEDDFVLFTLDKGIGGAVVIDGRVVSGIAGGAGEFGHMSIDPDGPLCRCGNRGCLEVYASLRNPLEAAAQRFGRPIAIEELVLRAQAGDVGCLRLIEDVAQAAGHGLGIIGSALNPPLIIVAGRLAQAGDLMMKPLEASFSRHSLIRRADVGEGGRTRFEVSRFVGSSACMGAVGLVLQHFGGRDLRPAG
jgi:predicted NBD/HSP70 family sugar kinase/biotin operon repressor